MECHFTSLEHPKTNQLYVVYVTVSDTSALVISEMGKNHCTRDTVTKIKKFNISIFMSHMPNLQAVVEGQYDICNVYSDNYKSTLI